MMEMFPALLTIFFSSFVIALSGAMMPGPLLTVTVTESSRRGLRVGPLMILGHGILEIILVVALLAGLAPVLLQDKVIITISLCGGAVLMWMAITMLRDLPRLSLSFENSGEKRKNLVLSGIVLSAANPYWFIWWASIGLGYIVYSAKFGILGIITFLAGHLLADLCWYACISYGVVRGKTLLSDKTYRRLIGGCALLLICFSGYFFYSGIDRLV